MDGDLLCQFISLSEQLGFSLRGRLICQHPLELKDNVRKFGRSQVWMVLQIEIITWPLRPDGRTV
jgi:hypothetical protein